MRTEVKEEVAMLVFTQMGFCVLGTLLNNIVFITLKDLPGLRASTHNVMFCHLTFINLLICTVVKPASAIYVSYAHALVSKGGLYVTAAVQLYWSISSSGNVICTIN